MYVIKYSNNTILCYIHYYVLHVHLFILVYTYNSLIKLQGCTYTGTIIWVGVYTGIKDIGRGSVYTTTCRC